jgi:hypothetical protein
MIHAPRTSGSAKCLRTHSRDGCAFSGLRMMSKGASSRIFMASSPTCRVLSLAPVLSGKTYTSSLGIVGYSKSKEWEELAYLTGISGRPTVSGRQRAGSNYPTFPTVLSPEQLRAERSDGAVLAFYPPLSFYLIHPTSHQDVRVHHNTHPSHGDHGHPILYRCPNHSTDSRSFGSSKGEL